ncbi:MAG: hypothetical protein IJV22_03625 [Bacteroidales bacterium]|nr:hypothetical protein [Bacteroidales bacterium]
MKRYLISLLSMTLLMVVVSFILMWAKPDFFLPIMPVVALFLAVVYGVQHVVIRRSMDRDARNFVRIYFVATTIALIVNLVVIIAWALTHVSTMKPFLVWYFVCYFAFLVFETVVQLLFVRGIRR